MIIALAATIITIIDADICPVIAVTGLVRATVRATCAVFVPKINARVLRFAGEIFAVYAPVAVENFARILGVIIIAAAVFPFAFPLALRSFPRQGSFCGGGS